MLATHHLLLIKFFMIYILTKKIAGCVLLALLITLHKLLIKLFFLEDHQTLLIHQIDNNLANIRKNKFEIILI